MWRINTSGRSVCDAMRMMMKLKNMGLYDSIKNALRGGGSSKLNLGVTTATIDHSHIIKMGKVGMEK